MSKKVFGLFLFFIILFLSFCMEIKAMDKGVTTEKITGGEFRVAESDYLDDVRTVLDTEGFYNAGINLNKVTTEQGGFAYTLLIRHRRFDKMSEEQKSELKKQLQNLTLDIRFSQVSIVYIDYMD